MNVVAHSSYESWFMGEGTTCVTISAISFSGKSFMSKYKIACGVEYDGTNYCGWQEQPDLVTVQGCVEKAISKVANHDVKIFCAGRTDTGVHARGQVIHFETDAERIEKAWIFGTNDLLPKDIAITWAKQVDNNFHARFSALTRTYHYHIHCQRSRPALDYHRACWYSKSLDADKMHEAAQYLIGEHDFSSFRGAKCQSHSPVRRVEEITVTQRHPQHIHISITSNAFLHHMVRNLVGVLLDIGCGKQKIEWAREVLHACDRTQAGITAPAEGLYLMNVAYPDEFDIPDNRV